jgi:hypothetical protein
MVSNHIWYNKTMKARLHTRIKQEFPDGSILSIVIWLLPREDVNRLHGYKYRLNYSHSDGSTIVRYDNERGKGDHKHIWETQTEYKFEGVEKLVEDFFADVKAQGG